MPADLKLAGVALETVKHDHVFHETPAKVKNMNSDYMKSERNTQLHGPICK